MATTEVSVQEGVEQVAEGLEQIAVATPRSLDKGVLLIGGIVIGASVGYLIAKRRLESKYQQLAEEEIEEIRSIYRAKSQGHRVNPQGAKETLEEVLEKTGYRRPTGEDTRYTEAEQEAIDEANRKAAEAEEAEPEIETHNIFHPGAIEGWDWVEERNYREALDEGIPYVLHRDEYFPNEKGYEQMSLTYFEGDDVLADDNDTPVDDQDAMVGLANLAKFGHGSGDPNIVYVRNDELQLEIEIIHSDGKFSEQVRGLPKEPPRDESGRFTGDPRKRRSRGNDR
jgi:hypothetical protein